MCRKREEKKEEQLTERNQNRNTVQRMKVNGEESSDGKQTTGDKGNNICTQNISLKRHQMSIQRLEQQKRRIEKIMMSTSETNKKKRMTHKTLKVHQLISLLSLHAAPVTG